MDFATIKTKLKEHKYKNVREFMDDMELVFRVAQSIHVLSYGKLLAQGTAEEIRHHPKVIEAYLGKAVEHAHE
jgi:ABC-type branched-subunit amino acid transport system ATPase component